MAIIHKRADCRRPWRAQVVTPDGVVLVNPSFTSNMWRNGRGNKRYYWKKGVPMLYLSPSGIQSTALPRNGPAPQKATHRIFSFIGGGSGSASFHSEG